MKNKEMIKEVIKDAMYRKFGEDNISVRFSKLKDAEKIFTLDARFVMKTNELQTFLLLVNIDKIENSSDLEDFFNEFKKELVKQKEDFIQYWIEIEEDARKRREEKEKISSLANTLDNFDI